MTVVNPTAALSAGRVRPASIASNGNPKRAGVVRAWAGVISLPTYLPALPDKNPMFLEKRVYQGSSGKVYPLPFTDRIAEQPVNRDWQAVWIENDFVRVLVLPELGGRIHAMLDKTNNYELIYNQHVIKPALVGLAGPWASGGIEFNWPQHHRPATFLPVDFEIEEHADGSRTIWCSDHDPMSRMKGMHGVCLHPGQSLVELKVRVHNRTPLAQTFLWWANVATRVHEAYQSFFPPDVYYVADHARRSMSEYPLAKGIYYGVDYRERGRHGIPAGETPGQFVPPHAQPATAVAKVSDLPDYAPNDLSFYANIPVPTSYMAMGSREDFFGGYDYWAQAGLVHVASHHLAPGKKQWTWGNQEFGYAWDRNLTDPDATGECGPYIEIMAGVFTDNQPDFSFLQPGETKSWSQYWYPIQKIGPVQQANVGAAVSLKIRKGMIRLGLSVTRSFTSASVVLTGKEKGLISLTLDLTPGVPFVREIKCPAGLEETDLRLRVADQQGAEIIVYGPKPRRQSMVPPAAREPAPPETMASADELYLTGLHLDQYRHATRCPTLYWCEALRRDPGDARCNNALGRWHLRRGEMVEAEVFFRRAIERLTSRNANPADGEAYYNLGLCLRHLGREDEAYEALYKSVWNQAWQSAGYHALAELDAKNFRWSSALGHLNLALRGNADLLGARNLKVIVLRHLKLPDQAASVLRETLTLDPLDWWARYLSGRRLDCDLPTALDVAHDFARAGGFAEAIELLGSMAAKIRDLPDQSWGTGPMLEYTIGWLHAKAGDAKTARKHYQRAALLPPDYCFPSRLEDIAILEDAIQANPQDARAPYYLGNLFYDRRRHAEAIRLWETSARLNPDFSIVWRNLGIGYFNIQRRPLKARRAYDRAMRANPADARLLYERDQLWKRLGEPPERRLRELRKFPDLVAQRDDLSVELCALLNQTGRSAEAEHLLAQRTFQPWEGGEGAALGQHVRTQLALGRQALAERDHARAARHFAAALKAPSNLGEAKHLLANQSDMHYWLGLALEGLGEKKAAREHWQAAASFLGDFQEMSAQKFSELTYFSACALKKLGRPAQAETLLRDLLAHAKMLQKQTARIDYFATSLPAMLLFEDDLQLRQEIRARFLQAQAWLGLGQAAKARRLLKEILKVDPNFHRATELPTTLSATR